MPSMDTHTFYPTQVKRIDHHKYKYNNQCLPRPM